MGREQTALREDLAKRKLKFIKGNRRLWQILVRDPRSPQLEGLLLSISFLEISTFLAYFCKFMTTRSMIYAIFFDSLLFIPWNARIKNRSLNSVAVAKSRFATFCNKMKKFRATTIKWWKSDCQNLEKNTDK